MRIPIIVPDLGCHGESLRISSWFVEKGDMVIAGDLVIEVLTPGMTFDVAAESSGRLVEIVKPLDSRIHDGEILGWLEVSNFEELPTDAPNNPS